MNPTTGRRLSGRNAICRVRYAFSSRVVVFLAVLAVAVWLFNQDVGWESRRRDSWLLAQAAEEKGDYRLARRHYLAALENQPYDWESHLFLARIEYLRINDFESALRHYRYALAYSPSQPVAEEARGEIATARMILRGDLENPRDALEDMFLAVDENAMEVFAARLSPDLAADAEAYWRGWRERGRGELNYCRIFKDNEGFLCASVELRFPDQSVMSIRFRCEENAIWLLESGIPMEHDFASAGSDIPISLEYPRSPQAMRCRKRGTAIESPETLEEIKRRFV